ncbi:1-acyl-sn-glycerol-3-phosphate acyltransferase, partial [Veillonella nakazawae]|nr:1-acyl-sn-glycerol-3-phosphate acyltransferase [Veillonella nakazawae]
CIICLAPHTSNWDFILGQLYTRAEGLNSKFLMKKEWFIGPLGSFFKKLGGIPVWRSRHSSMTDRLADLAESTPHFQ